MRWPIAIALGWLWLPSTALAWVQTQVGTGCGERWLGSTIDFHLQNVSLDTVSDGDYQATVDAAMVSWQTVACDTCQGAKANVPGTPCPSHPIGFTLENKGFAHTDTLGPDCTGKDAQGKCTGYSPNGNFIIPIKANWPFGVSVLSQTVVTANLSTGELVDADIAIDDVDHDFCVGNCSAGRVNLCDTLTHEMGHALGLGHSPDAQATMYAFNTAQPGEKCSLAQDDRDGICHAYTTTCDPSIGPATDASSSGSDLSSGGTTPAPGGCSAATRGTTVGAIFSLLLIFIAIWRRRQVT